MCGRIAQYRDAREYARAMTLTTPVFDFDPADRRPGFNLAPGAHPLAVLHDQTVRTIRWGYRPEWAAAQHLPQAINARSDSAASSGYFRDMWRMGRVIVPVDGWFEWRTEAGRSQPYYIHRRSDEPILLAGLSSVTNALEHQSGDGVVIVTVANASGIVDVHGHRPLIFDAQNALRWLDRQIDDSAVTALVGSGMHDEGDLAWHRVSQNVNRAVHDEAALIETID